MIKYDMTTILDWFHNIWDDMTSFVDRLLGTNDPIIPHKLPQQQQTSGTPYLTSNDKTVTFMINLPYDEYKQFAYMLDYLEHMKQLCRMGAELQEKWDDEFGDENGWTDERAKAFLDGIVEIPGTFQIQKFKIS